LLNLFPIGISLKLQEEERERRENYVPEVSVMEEMVDQIEIDPETKSLLRIMNMSQIPGVQANTSYRRDTYQKPSSQQQTKRR